MASRKRKTEIQDAFDAIAGFRDLVDGTFEKLTGKSIADWLKDFQRPRELPLGQTGSVQRESAMPLADAYAILGLKPGSPRDEAKERYRCLANLFHPDKGGYSEAMVLLNNAYDRITKGG